MDEILEKLKEIPLWQMIAGIISIILTIIFLSKTASYDSKRRKYNKKADKLDASMYAGAFLGVAMSIWTAIACVLIGLAVVSFVMMLIAKSRCNKAEEEYEDKLEEYNRNQRDLDERRREAEYSRRDDEYRRHREEDNMRRDEEYRRRDEDMQMMLMRMFGGNMGGAEGAPQGAYVGMQRGIAPEEMRAIISDTVTALLPGMQQLLPQQASTNDELVQKLLEKSEKNEETIQKMMEKSQKNDETISQIVKNQEELIAKLLERDAVQQVAATQVVEKVVEVPVEVEKIVEKEVVKEVPVEVEKIVEKEVKVEVPVEKIVEVPVEKVVEKVVEKEIKVEVSAPAKTPKERAPRLTLDEAYARLSKQQKKYFDSLREYALSKDKSKEKKSTYFILLGQSSVNPLIKLTIKKDTTVALFKMEDEYLKDIRKDATNDGTKIKV
ncbi:MAG: hypothetical protein K2L61_02705, partial [Clostridia bacterium]|nr:hypothetical protein [Clostridia bacterium]